MEFYNTFLDKGAVSSATAYHRVQFGVKAYRLLKSHLSNCGKWGLLGTWGRVRIILLLLNKNTCGVRMYAHVKIPTWRRGRMPGWKSADTCTLIHMQLRVNWGFFRVIAGQTVCSNYFCFRVAKIRFNFLGESKSVAHVLPAPEF